MKLTRFVVSAAVAAGLIATPLLAAAPASAAPCLRDPYNGVCVSVPWRYHAQSRSGSFVVQRAPHLYNGARRVSARITVSVICQINNGGGVPGYRNHTWNAVAGGGWVFSANLHMPLAPNGYTPGVRHCGARPASAPAPVPPPATTASLNPADYPWPAQDGWQGDGHGYWQGECVSFVAWAIRSDGRPHTASPDRLGNANQWATAVIDAVPVVGDVAQWDAGRNGAGSAGHVAYVAAVNPGTVTVWEYNWGNFHRFNTRTIPDNAPSRYLHF